MKYQKFILLFFIAVFIKINSFAETNPDCYRVLAIRGEVKKLPSHELIKQNDKICSHDSIVFLSDKSSIRVFHNSMGIFTVRPKSYRYRENELVGLIKSFLIQHDKLSVRATAKSFESEFENTYLIINQSRIKIDTAEYKINKNTEFLTSFLYMDTVVTKKIEINNDSLIIYKNDFLPFNASSKETSLNISFYYLPEKGISKLIHKFDLLLLDESELRLEVGILIDELKEQNLESPIIKKMVESYLYDFYGKTNKYDLNVWLGDNFSL